jgi:hypothetical protein
MNTFLDDRWFDAVRAIGNQVDEAQWLREHIRISEEEKDQFLNNEIENPEFSYGKGPKNEFNLNEISDLRAEIQRTEKDAVVLDLYLHKLERLEEGSVMLSALMNRSDTDFYQASVKLYGKPKKKYFSYVAKQITGLCDANKNENPVISKRLKRLVSKIDQTGSDISVDILPPIVPDSKTVASVSEVERIFQETLDRLEIEGWTIKIDDESSRSKFSVKPYSQIIHIPNQAQLLLRPRRLTETQIQALAEHEIGVHVRRAYEGSRSSLRLLQLGLDSHHSGEEGLASYVQQQIEGADEFYGFDRYFAACLATGMDGTKRDFRAVFSVMTDYYTLKYATEDVSESAAFNAAWDVCVRIFRGTSGRTPGAIYTKDIVYMEGNIGVWHLISDKPHVFESLFLGKFNPLISRHVKSLQTLDILKEW